MNTNNFNFDDLFGHMDLPPIDPPGTSVGNISNEGGGKENDNSAWVWWVVGVLAFIVGRALYIDHKKQEEEIKKNI